jgi:hypothetical protein
MTWRKISGPASFDTVNTTGEKAIVKNLDTGFIDLNSW